LDRIYAYIATENPKAAAQVFRRIRRAAGSLAQFPHSGRLGQAETTRELVVTGLPYVVVYRIRGNEVEVLRVFHMAMDRPMGGFQ
jgi:toxin ParE1/3/4